jgi:hypothetical protein
VLEARQKTTSVWWLDVSIGARQVAPHSDDAELGAGAATLQWSDCPK